MVRDVKFSIGVAVFAVLLTLVFLGTSVAETASAWTPGDEAVFFNDHTFTEESWYTTVEHETEENDTAEFGVSFMNMGDIEAFLITLNHVEDVEGNVGVLPYQMFGMHYYTGDGAEVFLGALLAFLCVYNDTNDDGVPNKGEDFFYVVPFGVGSWLQEETGYTPTVTNMGVKKISENHYQMGITYKNLYAIASQNPLLTALFATGWVFKFTEFSVTYDIRLDPETGTLTTETFYTIGQVTDLWAVILGFPIKVDDVHETLPDNFGIGAVHFSTIFTSNYKVVENKTGSELDGNIEKEVEGEIEVETGGSRAFSVGLRGDFDVIDEDTDTVLVDDDAAKNMILQPKVNDLILVAWQLAFSATVFVGMAYGLSSYVRESFGTMNDMETGSTKQTGATGFGSQAFWYGVFFPGWDGYRVEHDPTYTAYFGDGQASGGGGVTNEESPGFTALALLGSTGLIATVAVLAKKRRK